MRPNIFAAAVSTAAVLFFIFSFTGCNSLMSAFQEPKITLQSADVAGITLEGTRVLCKVKVENPNSFTLPFPDTDWEFFINKGSFIKGNLRSGNKIKARGSTIIEVPVDLKYNDVFNSFKSLIGSKEAEYKVALGLRFNYPIIREKIWNLEKEGTLPIPQLPKIKTPSMRMENANTTRAEISVTVNIENPNSFDLPMPKIEYDYQLNKKSFIKGNLEDEGKIAAGKTTPVTFKLIVNYADLFRNIPSLLTAFQTNSLLIVTCDFGLPMLSKEPVRFEASGTLPVLR